jgi:hypothetical protein
MQKKTRLRFRTEGQIAVKKPGFWGATLWAGVVLFAQDALAAPVYDARTLGMGNSSVGLAENASLAFWNPAAVAMGKSSGVFLPSLAFYAGNNIVSPTALASLLQQAGPSGAEGFANAAVIDLLRNAGSDGLTVAAEGMFEPLGVSLGQVGPGALAFRAYGRGVVRGTVSLSRDFTNNLEDLFGNNNKGLNDIIGAVGNLSRAVNNLNPTNDESLNQARSDVGNLQALLTKNMSSFIKPAGAATTRKELRVNAVSTAHAALAATYGQTVPITIKALPEAELNLGVTTKLFTTPAAQLASAGAIALPGGSPNARLSPLGGGVTTRLALDIDREVSDLVEAIGDFDKEQNLATIAQLTAKTANFLDAGLAKSRIEMTNLIPDNNGVGVDLGAAFRVNRELSVGLTLVNPVLLWGATRTTHTYSVNASGVRLTSTAPVRTSFAEVEPTILRTGLAWTPRESGLIVQGSFEKAFADFPLSVNLGLEKKVGPLALRLGTQQGAQPLYTMGLGLQTRDFQLNFGLGMDNLPNQARALASSLTLGTGF